MSRGLWSPGHEETDSGEKWRGLGKKDCTLRDNSFWRRYELELLARARWPQGSKVLAGLGQRNFRLQRFGKEQREKDLNFSESWDIGVSLCLSVSASMKYMLDYFSLLNFHFLRDAMSDMWVLRLKRPGLNYQTRQYCYCNFVGSPFTHLHNGNNKTYFSRLLERWNEVMSGKKMLKQEGFYALPWCLLPQEGSYSPILPPFRFSKIHWSIIYVP